MGNSVFGVRLSESEHGYLDSIASQTDGILSKAGVLRVLVRHAQASGWNPLDSAGTLGLAEASKASPFSSSYSSSSKKRTNKELSIYPGLEKHEELIREFWRVKKGSKSEQGWKLLMTELGKLQKLYGDAVVTEQLQLAANGLWKGISVRLYEQFKAPKGGAPAQPEHKHPAAREFRNGRFVDEPTSGGVLEGLF